MDIIQTTKQEHEDDIFRMWCWEEISGSRNWDIWSKLFYGIKDKSWW